MVISQVTNIDRFGLNGSQKSEYSSGLQVNEMVDRGHVRSRDKKIERSGKFIRPLHQD